MLFDYGTIKTRLAAISGGRMETVKIVNVQGKMSKKNTPYYQLTFEDGRKATTFDAAAADMNGCLVVAEFKNNGDFLNVKIIRMVAREDRPGAIATGVPSFDMGKASEKASVNPVFAFLGACSMVSALVLDSFHAGNNVEDTNEIIRKNFSAFYQTAYDMLKAHMGLEEYVEAAEKLDA